MSGRLPINSAPVSLTHGTAESDEHTDSTPSYDQVQPSGFDLDDHRLQPSYLPRINSDKNRRGTAASISNDGPDLLSADHGTITRDFEHAVTDDDKSVVGSPTDNRMRRKSTLKRNIQSVSRDDSRDSSTSPPNS